MKKGLFLIVAVAILVVALAGTAYGAIWNVNKSYRTGPSSNRQYPFVHQTGAAGRGYMYVNGSGTRIPFGTPGSVEGSATYVYLQWKAVNGTSLWAGAFGGANTPAGNVGATSPHGGFVTNSVKCAVCHSVHTAAPGRDDAGVVTADTLLRTKASDACAYCHVAAPNTVSDPVFGGIYPVPNEAGHALGEPDCTECHTNVHGAGAETIPPLAGKLLTLATDYGTASGGSGSTVISRVTAIDASATAQGFTGPVTGFSAAQYQDASFLTTHTAMVAQAVGVFCGGCHEGSYANTIAGASASNALGQRAGEFSGHRTMAQAGSTWNADGTTSSSEHEGIKVADRSATNCYSCHDAEDGFGNGEHAFPHNWGTVPGQLLTYESSADEFTNQTFAWLLKASASGSALTTSGGVVGKTAHLGVNGGTLSDGVCLKCHRWNEGAVSSGVGASY